MLQFQAQGLVGDDELWGWDGGRLGLGVGEGVGPERSRGTEAENAGCCWKGGSCNEAKGEW